MKRKLIKSLAILGLASSLVLCPKINAKAADVIEITKDVSLGQTISDTLNTGTAKYNFKVTRSGTVTVQIGFLEGSSYSWGWHGSVTIYNNDGKKMGDVDVRDNTSGTDSGVITVDLLAGDYYLYVTKGGSGKSNYVMTTSYIDSQETIVDSMYNPHNNNANPIAYQLGSTYTGHLAANSTNDVYTFYSNKNQYVTFNLSNHTRGLSLNVVNENNTVNISNKTSAGTQSVKVFCPKGKYYVTVGKYDATGVYTINTKTSEIPTTKISKVSNKKGKILAVRFGLKSTDVVNGYQIQYSKMKNFKKGNKSVTVVNSNYLSKNYNISIRKKDTYYVRIRTFVKDNRGDCYYSKWSNAKKVTIKK